MSTSYRTTRCWDGLLKNDILVVYLFIFDFIFLLDNLTDIDAFRLTPHINILPCYAPHCYFSQTTFCRPCYGENKARDVTHINIYIFFYRGLSILWPCRCIQYLQDKGVGHGSEPLNSRNRQILYCFGDYQFLFLSWV